VAWCLGIIALEPPYCAASLVARAGIDYTTALFFAWRWAMKPRPSKPISIMAQVEGSGTAEKLSCVRHCAPHIEYRTRASTSVATITATRKRQSILDIGCPPFALGISTRTSVDDGVSDTKPDRTVDLTKFAFPRNAFVPFTGMFDMIFKFTVPFG
jgi:hypothetical protein